MDMNINMNDSNIVSLRQVEETILSRVAPAFSFESHEKAYALISEVLNRFGYHEKGRTKKEKTPIQKDFHAGGCPTSLRSRQCLPEDVGHGDEKSFRG